jgi:capsular polysaccharide biosynthesis protein
MYLNVQESNLILNPKNLVLITRNEKTRNFGNKNEVIRFFKELATASNLNFILLESDTTTLSEYKSSLENAKIVVALHGGANYNLIFAHRQCIFFEFIPTRNTNSLLNFIVSLGICYIPVPVDADFNDHFVYIGAEILEEISKIAKIFNRQNN